MEDTNDLPEQVDATNSEEENKSAISADLIRGHINTIILRTLYERDKYGYEIIEEIEKKSHGQYSLKQPTLYSALKRLESQGYINAYWKTDEVSLGGRRKYYTLTDSGREITEKNQAEWEYSRTVIDNLISDRSFDFTQPPPTSVDFKILKKSTSRVPIVKDSDDDEDDEDENITKEPVAEKLAEAQTENVSKTQTSANIPEIEIKPETVTYSEQVIFVNNPTPVAEQAVKPVEASPVIPPVQENAQSTPVTDDEQRRIAHENYLKLISEPVTQKPEEVNVVPVADKIDTEKLIYNNKPETERDYKNLINNLFDRTVKHNPKTVAAQTPVQRSEEQTAKTVKLEDINIKANNDGLKVNSSEYVINDRKKSYNRGGTLFKCSLIVAIVLLLEFAICLLFKNDLGIGIAYPFVIFAIAIAQLMIFGVLYYTDLSKITRKPTSNLYLSACIIVTVILILIIFIVAILLKVNFTSVSDIFAKIIIPCIVALNIPLFAGCFYAFSKSL